MSPNRWMESRTIWCGMPPRSTWAEEPVDAELGVQVEDFSATCAGPPIIKAPRRAARVAMVLRSTKNPRPPLVSGERYRS